MFHGFDFGYRFYDIFCVVRVAGNITLMVVLAYISRSAKVFSINGPLSFEINAEHMDVIDFLPPLLADILAGNQLAHKKKRNYWLKTSFIQRLFTFGIC